MTLADVIDKVLGNEPKQVDVKRAYDGYAHPVLPSWSLNQPPDVTDVDDQPPITNPFVSSEHMRWVDMLIDRGDPRMGELTTHQLLARICDLLSQDRQVDVPSDFTHLRSKSFPVGTAYTYVLEGLTQYGYLYIAPCPVILNVWLGEGNGQPIIANPINTPLNLRIPHIDKLTLTFDNGTAGPITVYPYLSTRPFTVTRG